MFAQLKSNKKVIIALILLVTYIGFQFVKHQIHKHQLAEEALEDAVFPVAVVQAHVPDDVETITLPGNIEAWYQASIYAQVSGYVKMWYKDYGAEVKKGDVLAEINTPALDAQYEQAKADMMADKARYELAALTAKRYAALRRSKAVSEQSISVKEANARAEIAKYNAAMHVVNNYQARIKFKTIVAPYDGIITSREINVGDYVNKEGNLAETKGKSNLFTIADIHKLRLFVSIPERFGRFLKPGLTADVVVPQYPNRHYTAEFLTVSKGFDVDTRTAVTEFVINNEDRSIWSGSYGQVTLSVPVEQTYLVIPSTALVFEENGTEVAVVTEDNKVHYKKVTVSKIMDATMEISEGITLNDRIIDNPSAAMLEGDEVRIVTPAKGYIKSDFHGKNTLGSNGSESESNNHKQISHKAESSAPAKSMEEAKTGHKDDKASDETSMKDHQENLKNMSQQLPTEATVAKEPKESNQQPPVPDRKVEEAIKPIKAANLNKLNIKDFKDQDAEADYDQAVKSAMETMEENGFAQALSSEDLPDDKPKKKEKDNKSEKKQESHNEVPKNNDDQSMNENKGLEAFDNKLPKTQAAKRSENLQTASKESSL